MTADIIDLPQRDDDTIPVVCGLPLVDADPKIMARRLGPSTWEDRARFFDNIINQSFENMVKMGEFAATEDGTRAFYDWAMLKMHEQIGRTLDVWGEAKPGEDLAAAIYALSLNPQHRHEARGYFKNRGGGYASRQFNDVAGDRMSLCVFYNMSGLTRPGLGYAWRYGIPEESEAEFNAPEGGVS